MPSAAEAVVANVEALVGELSFKHFSLTVLSLRAGGGVFPRLLLLENRRKIEPKEIPSHLIPRLLVAFTRQLEILVTSLFEISFSDLKMQFPEGISPELVMCVPLPIKHISLVICVPLPIKTHIPSYMCSPTWETHIVICGPLARKHISLYCQA